jgi:hypothetical protein
MAAALRNGGHDQPMKLQEFALLLLAMGDLERPLGPAREIVRHGQPPLLLAYMAWAQAKTGDKAAAEATLREVLAAPPSQFDDPLERQVNYLVALTRAKAGDVPEALSAADRLMPLEKSRVLVAIARDEPPPDFQSLVLMSIPDPN